MKKQIIFFNPFTELIDCAKEIFPEIKCKIYFVKLLKRCKGVTIFPDNNTIPIIEIDSRLKLHRLVDIMAHELAHVICAQYGNFNHDENWERVYDALNQKFNLRTLHFIEKEHTDK